MDNLLICHLAKISTIDLYCKYSLQEYNIFVSSAEDIAVYIDCESCILYTHHLPLFFSFIIVGYSFSLASLYIFCQNKTSFCT